VAEDLVRIQLFCCRHFKRQHRIAVLPRDPENFAAGCQDRDARTHSDERFSQHRRRINDVFAVVEHQQKVFFGEGPRDGFRR
jgi:hypothetical protein